MANMIVGTEEEIFGLKIVYDPEEINREPDITICQGEDWAIDLLKESEKWTGVKEAHVVKTTVDWRQVE